MDRLKASVNVMEDEGAMGGREERVKVIDEQNICLFVFSLRQTKDYKLNFVYQIYFCHCVGETALKTCEMF
jgi:hypothetical protein